MKNTSVRFTLAIIHSNFFKQKLALWYPVYLAKQ